MKAGPLFSYLSECEDWFNSENHVSKSYKLWVNHVDSPTWMKQDLGVFSQNFSSKLKTTPNHSIMKTYHTWTNKCLVQESQGYHPTPTPAKHIALARLSARSSSRSAASWASKSASTWGGAMERSSWELTCPHPKAGKMSFRLPSGIWPCYPCYLKRYPSLTFFKKNRMELFYSFKWRLNFTKLQHLVHLAQTFLEV